MFETEPYPRGVACLPDGGVAVAEAGSNRVTLFDGEGRRRASSRDDACLDEPSGLAIAADGRLCVADSGNNRVQVTRALAFCGSLAGLTGARGRVGRCSTPAPWK